MQRFTGRNAGVGRGNGVGESACLVPWDPSNLQTEQGYVPDMKAELSIMGLWSIRFETPSTLFQMNALAT
jgi:hypothetical protein